VADEAGGPGAPEGEEEAYFQAIERRFAQLRGTPLLLSPKDWTLVGTWHREGIPLRVVLEALESVFHARREGGGDRPRPVLSLSYCRHAVEEAFREWRESRLGAPSGAPADDGGGGARAEEAARCLSGWAGELRGLHPVGDARGEALEEAARQLEDLARELQSATPPTLAAAEERLEAVEDRMLDRLLALLDGDARRALERSVREELEPLRSRLTAHAFDSTFRGHLRGLLREREQLPRLTLYRL
jgi:hypothetical protein